MLPFLSFLTCGCFSTGTSDLFPPMAFTSSAIFRCLSMKFLNSHMVSLLVLQLPSPFLSAHTNCNLVDNLPSTVLTVIILQNSSNAPIASMSSHAFSKHLARLMTALDSSTPPTLTSPMSFNTASTTILTLPYLSFSLAIAVSKFVRFLITSFGVPSKHCPWRYINLTSGSGAPRPTVFSKSRTNRAKCLMFPRNTGKANLSSFKHGLNSFTFLSLPFLLPPSCPSSIPLPETLTLSAWTTNLSSNFWALFNISPISSKSSPIWRLSNSSLFAKNPFNFAFLILISLSIPFTLASPKSKESTTCSGVVSSSCKKEEISDFK